jgi:anti-anti-sigma factor
MGTKRTGAAERGDDAVDVRHEPGSRPEEVVVTVAGELDAANSSAFGEELTALIDSGAREIVIHAEGLSFIDSSGLRVLVDALDHARERGGNLVIRSLSTPVRKVFEVTGLTGLFAL